MTIVPAYACTRNARRERDICLGLARHHSEMAVQAQGEERLDHQRAEAACRENAAKWERFHIAGQHAGQRRRS